METASPEFAPLRGPSRLKTPIRVLQEAAEVAENTRMRRLKPRISRMNLARRSRNQTQPLIFNHRFHRFDLDKTSTQDDQWLEPQSHGWWAQIPHLRQSAPSAVNHSDGLGRSSGNVVRNARFADIVIRIETMIHP